MRGKRADRVNYAASYWLIFTASKEELADYLRIDKKDPMAWHALERLIEAARAMSTASDK